MTKPNVIWAVGAYRAKYTHAYVSEEAYQRGECICGRKIAPSIRFDQWDLNEQLALEHTCPTCLERLKLFKYI